MRVLGVDPSSRCLGLALLDGEQLLWAMSANLKGNLADRLLVAAGVVRRVVDKERPDAVVMETPGPWTRGAAHSTTRTVEVLAMVRGAIAAVVSAAGVPCHEMTVSRARHLLFGKGNTKKHVVIDTLRMMGYDVPLKNVAVNAVPVYDHDAADALVVALAWQRERAFEERVKG